MRLIDADALKERFRDELDASFIDDYGNGFQAGVLTVNSAPTVDAEPVAHAHWDCGDYPKESATAFKCSRCGRYIVLRGIEVLSDYPYCHCGAKMDEEVK